MRTPHTGRKPYSGSYFELDNTKKIASSTENQPLRLNQYGRLMAAGDAGMVTNYQAAVHSKPAAQLNAIQRLFNKMIGYVSPDLTTQQGSAASSPAVAQFLLYSLRYERWQVIGDCNNIYADDGRVHQSVDMFVEEAVRKGVLITVTDRGDRATKRLNQRAQQVCDGVQKLLPTSFLESCGKATIVEGELFWHISTYENQVINVERRPASAMERNTNDADEFVDVNKAFSQIDTTTTQEVATYPLWQIWHGRWNYMDGDRYGTSSLACVRRLYRLLELAEEAQLRRRLVRAPQRKHWVVGTEDHPGTKLDVDKLKNEIGMVEGNMSQYDPVNTAIDYFTTNMVKCDVLNGDGTVHEIEDLKYFENVFSSALPTPGAIYNLASSDVNRDVLEDQRAQWLNRTKKLNDFLTSGIRFIVDIALMLADIDPATITYSVHWSESNTETPKEIVERTLLLLNNGVGDGATFTRIPLISHRKALSCIAEYADITDIDAEIAAIDADLKNNIGLMPLPQPVQMVTSTKTTTSATGANKTETTNTPAPLSGNYPSGRVSNGEKVKPLAAIKPITKTVDTGKPIKPVSPLTSKPGPGGSKVGPGQEAAPISETYGVQKDLPEGY